MSDDYNDLLETLKWEAKLELTPHQRKVLLTYCSQIAGVEELKGHQVPLSELLSERKKREKVEKRIEDSEAKVARLKKNPISRFYASLRATGN